MSSDTRQLFVWPISDYTRASSMDPYDLIAALEEVPHIEELRENDSQLHLNKCLSGEEQRFCLLASNPEISVLSEAEALKQIALLMTTSVTKVKAIRKRASQKLRNQEFRT